MNKPAQTTYTPMMEQYLEIKKDYRDFIVFFRLGDFYEMFFTDAIVASKELEIVLTGRDAGQPERVPMCGVPYHAVNVYIERLVEKGYKVAIVEQTEDPALAKGIVKREVIKLITPGTIIEEGFIDEKTNNYIGALSETKNTFLLAYSDLTTGQNSIISIPKDYSLLISEIYNLNAKELVVSSKFNQKNLLSGMENYPLTISISDEIQLPSYYQNLVSEIYDKDLTEVFGRLINYLVNTQKRQLMHLQKVQVFESNQYLHIDNNSQRNLELTQTLRFGNRKGSLFWLLDQCVTAMGSRYLKQTILRPLVDQTRIENRFNLIENFNENFIVFDEVRELLKSVYDLERIVGRISFGNANAKDLINLAKSLKVMPLIKASLSQLNNAYVDEMISHFHQTTDLVDLIERAIVSDPPLSIKEGGIIRAGYNSELDQIKYQSTDGKDWLTEFETKERERTGIKKLKVGYNRVFGYYIEISKGQIELVDESFGYVRKQT